MKCTMLNCDKPVSRKTIFYSLVRDEFKISEEREVCEYHYYGLHLGIERIVCEGCNRLILIDYDDFFDVESFICPFCEMEYCGHGEE